MERHAFPSEAASPARPAQASPGLYARTLLAAAIGGITFLGYFRYKADGFNAPHALDERLHGLAAAPDQYRVGVYALACAMATHLHIAPSMAFSVLGAVAGLAGALLLFSVLQRSAVYAQADRTLQWLVALAFVLLILWTLPWTFFPERPETLPAAGCVGALVWLWQPARRAAWLTALAIPAISAALASFRADVACVLHLGILAYVLAAREPALALPRWAAAVTAALAALASGGVQLWLTHIVYPQATYGPVKLWLLWPNLIHATRWPPFAVFVLPLIWLLVRGLRSGFVRDGVGRAVLAGALLYAALWITVGKIDEVRIFLPFAWALAPLTAQMLMQRATSDRAETPR
jgi:hypothetical protein